MDQFRVYVGGVRISSVDRTIVTRADSGRNGTLEYEVHGTILAPGARYYNRFCSILSFENRKIATWRDYMDSHVVWTALTEGTGRVR